MPQPRTRNFEMNNLKTNILDRPAIVPNRQGWYQTGHCPNSRLFVVAPGKPLFHFRVRRRRLRVKYIMESQEPGEDLSHNRQGQFQHAEPNLCVRGISAVGFLFVSFLPFNSHQGGEMETQRWHRFRPGRNAKSMGVIMDYKPQPRTMKQKVHLRRLPPST